MFKYLSTTAIMALFLAGCSDKKSEEPTIIEQPAPEVEVTIKEEIETNTEPSEEVTSEEVTSEEEAPEVVHERENEKIETPPAGADEE